MTEQTIKYAERRAKAYDLLDEVCAHCGTTEKMSIDHINNDRSDAKHMPNRLLLCSWDGVVAELKNCQLLCKSCHAKKSMRERGFADVSGHGKESTYSHGCRCDSCKSGHAMYQFNWRKTRKVLA